MDNDVDNIKAGRTRLGRPTAAGEFLKRVMPDQAVGVSKLREAMRSWPSIVVLPGVARGSSPYDLISGTLYVAAGSSHVKQRIEQMKGNIRRALQERCGLDVRDIRVTLGAPPPAPKQPSVREERPVVVQPDAETVRAFRAQCPEELPPEAADALAHLRAFFARRFHIKEVFDDDEETLL